MRQKYGAKQKRSDYKKKYYKPRKIVDEVTGEISYEKPRENITPWLDAIWRANGKQITENFNLYTYGAVNDPNVLNPGKVTAKKEFYRLMRSAVAQGMQPSRALRAVSAKAMFSSYVERAHVNLEDAMKKHGVWKSFRAQTRGEYDPSRFEYRKDLKGYVYHREVGMKASGTKQLGRDDLLIQFVNSPERIDISHIARSARQDYTGPEEIF